MTFRKISNVVATGAVAFLFALSLCPMALAQGPIPDAPIPAVAAAAPLVESPRSFDAPHKFWDRQNRVLFIASAALNMADFAVTRSNLQSGGQELNPLVRPFGRSTAGLALNFAGETVGVVSVSYFFHKTGHHKLERAVSLVNIGSSAGAVTYGLMHR